MTPTMTSAHEHVVELVKCPVARFIIRNVMALKALQEFPSHSVPCIFMYDAITIGHNV